MELQSIRGREGVIRLFKFILLFTCHKEKILQPSTIYTIQMDHKLFIIIHSIYKMSCAYFILFILRKLGKTWTILPDLTLLFLLNNSYASIVLQVLGTREHIVKLKQNIQPVNLYFNHLWRCFCIKMFNKCLALEMKMFCGGKWDISESHVSQNMTNSVTKYWILWLKWEYKSITLHPTVLCWNILTTF